MIKAVLIDFYGTLVKESGPVVEEALQKICSTGKEKNPGKVFGVWWKCFNRLVEEANRGEFANQFTLALRAFEETVRFCESLADPGALCERMIEQWAHPEPYPESRAFLEELERKGIPYYLVTNGDSRFLDIAVQELGAHPAGVISSEKAGAYKPDIRIFREALRQAGILSEEAVHIGDSAGNDYEAAKKAGILAVWLNRGQAAALPENSERSDRKDTETKSLCQITALRAEQVWEALEKAD